MAPKIEMDFVTSTPMSPSGEDSVEPTTITDTFDITPSTAAFPLFLPPLTTIFTPPTRCQGRYYVTETEGFDLIRDIYSGSEDALYQSCQPFPDLSATFYSPAACPHNMDIAMTLVDIGGTDTTRVDICCQSGFTVWEIHSCYSLVSTTTMVLSAPTASDHNDFVLVSSVTAWHTAILAAWELADLPLFPSEVSSRKSSIAKYGWAGPSTSTTSVPLASTMLESSSPAPEDSDKSEGILLNHGVIAGIVVAAVAFLGFAVASIYAYRRLRQRQNRPGGMGTVLPDNRGTWLGNAWRTEMSSPATPSQLPTDETRGQGPGKPTPVELDSGSAISPIQSQGCRSIVSSISHQVASLSPALVTKSAESKDHGEGTEAGDKEPCQKN
ncbi:hypothetical protein F5B22DRAFT_28655 [Xylaria bambusicola]|uniref:uncharacterized protein n=1 Tax=Xylaria bambusicola TaxID=326684 RepID=UPI002008B957|nr:uncharacterized protein F5B22DRAFT_28655 [Xylaria bambusicola]KAI0528256.1 hypothetical protein F5B22DRAFT_28655 [Xylaria bambusicola]